MKSSVCVRNGIAMMCVVLILVSTFSALFAAPVNNMNESVATSSYNESECVNESEDIAIVNTTTTNSSFDNTSSIIEMNNVSESLVNTSFMNSFNGSTDSNESLNESLNVTENGSVQHVVTTEEKEETSDQNNTSHELPDLVVTLIDAPERIYVNSSTIFNVTIENLGAQDAASFYLALKANETGIDNKSINALLTGESVTLNFSWTPQNTGFYNLTAVADPANGINESNETNNQCTINITVLKETTHDLVIKDIQTPDRIYSTVPTKIVAIIENNGTETLSSFKIAFCVNDGILCVKTVNALAAAANTTVFCDWTPDYAGNYTLNVTADPDKELHELNENNNVNTLKVSVLPVSPTDLVVVEVATTATFFAGELNPVKARIKNEGVVARNFSVSFTVNGKTEDTRTIPALGFNTTASVVFGWVPESEGGYQLNITVYPGNVVSEVDETNNNAEKEVQVNPVPVWLYEENITVENPLNHSLHDYPVLLTLDTSIFNYTEVKKGGEDISFKTVDNVPIPYWIELWNRSGESRIWLRLDVVPVGRHKLKMYWKASDMSSRSEGQLVFDFFEDFECADCFDSWSHECVRYGVDTACNFSLSGDTPDNSSYAARITAYKWTDCISIVYNNMGIVQPWLEFWMRIEAERDERLRAGVVIGDVAADNYSRVFETDNVTDWHLVDVNLTEYVGRNADFGFFSENNWWDYNVTFSVDNIRLRESESREPFVDFGLADVAPMNISPRYRNLYAEFQNQIYVNITNNGTANARNFSVLFNLSDEAGNETLHSQRISLLHKNTTTLVFIWEPPHAGNYTLSVHVDTGDCVEEANETNNVIEKDVYVNPATEWWGFAFKEDVHVKPLNGELIEYATVLLTLDPSIFDYTKTNPDGSDVRIKGDNGTDLPYWLERWNTSGESHIWFRADVPVDGRTVYLCYGNGSAHSRGNASAVNALFEDWEDGDASVERWENLNIRCRDDAWGDSSLEKFSSSGNYSLKMQEDTKRSMNAARRRDVYRDVEINSGDLVLSGELYLEELEYYAEAAYIIDAEVAGKTYHLKYGVFGYQPSDTQDTFYFPINPSEVGDHWYYIHRSLRNDLLRKCVNISGNISIKRVSHQVYARSFASLRSVKVGAYFDNIALVPVLHSPTFADLGNASLSVETAKVENFKGFYTNSPSNIGVLVNNTGKADARDFSIHLSLEDIETRSELLMGNCFVPHKSSRRFAFEWMPPHTGDYTVNVTVYGEEGIKASNKTEIHVYPDLEWRYEDTIELRCAEDRDDVAAPIVINPAIFDYANANPDGSDFRVRTDNGVDLPLWIEYWNTSGESRIWTRLAVPQGRKVHLWYGSENAMTASNATAVASFCEDWHDYPEFAEYTYTTSMNGWHLQTSNANGYVRIRNESLLMNVSSDNGYYGTPYIGVYSNPQLNSEAPQLFARLKVEDTTSTVAYIRVDVNVTGKTYHLRYGNVCGEEFDFNSTSLADGAWHLVHRDIREDLEKRGVAVDGNIKVKQVLLQIEGLGTAYFDDIVILDSDSTLRVGGMQKPDLKVRFTDVPKEVRHNRTVPIAVAVLNLGVDAPEFNVSFSVSGELVQNCTLEGITRMGNATCTFNWTPMRFGATTLEIIADPENVIAEADEGNNNASRTVEVVAPDLFISGVRMPEFGDVSYCFLNTTNNIPIVVNNSGTADLLNESFNVSLAVNGLVVQQNRYNISINRNESGILDFHWTPTTMGNYMLVFVLDSRHEIAEITEGNNSFAMNVSIVAQMDLVIEEVDVHKKRYAGFMNPVRARVSNKGDLNVTFNMTFTASSEVTSDNETIEKRLNLSANACEEVVFKWVPTQAGIYNLSVVADENNEITAPNDAKTWYGTYDVTETDLIPPTAVVVTGNVAYENGRACANDTFAVDLTLINGAARKFGTATNNSTYLVVLPVRYNDSVLNVSATDYGGNTNNTRIEIDDDIEGEGFLDFNVTLPLELPDLAVTKLGVYPPSPVMLNMACWVNATLENIGTNTSRAFNVSLVVTDGQGKVVENVTKQVEPMNYGVNVKVPFLWTPTAAGRFSVSVEADVDDDLVESTDRNNRKEMSVDVASSDLIVDIEPPYDLFVNVPNTIIATVRNIGDADLTSADDRFEQPGISVELRILNGNTTLLSKYEELHELNASESKTVTFDWQPSATGDYTLKVIVDPSDDIVETNETNNEVATEREVYEPMAVEMLLYSGGGEPYYMKYNVIAGSSLFNATVKGCTLIGVWQEQDQLVYTNDTGTITGVADIDAPDLWFYENGLWRFVGIANVSFVLEKGQIFGWAPPGIDINDPNLRLIPKPDFVPVAMQMPRTLYLGRQIPVELRIENIGLESNTTEVELRVRTEGGDSWHTEDFGTVFVPAHGNATLSLKWLARAPGLHEIRVVVDPNESDEIDETNNNMTEERVVVTGTIIDVPRDFPTIREAVEDAAPDTVIYVHEGRYNAYSWKSSYGRPQDYFVLNRIDIVDKNNITIIGDGWDTVLNSNFPRQRDEWWKPLINIINSSDITIMNLALIEGGVQHELLHIENSRDITMENCKIKSTIGPSVNHALSNRPLIVMKNTSYCRFSNNLIYSREVYNGNHQKHGYGVYPAIFVDQRSNNNLIFNNTLCKVYRAMRVEGDNNTIHHNNFYREHAFEYWQQRDWWTGVPLSNWTVDRVAPIVSDAGTGNLWDNNYWGEHFVVANFSKYSRNNVIRTENLSEDVWRSCYTRIDVNNDGILDDWYASPDPVYGNPVTDHYPLIEPYGVDMDAGVEGFTLPNKVYAGRGNVVHVMLKRVTKDISPEQFNVTLYVREESGGWYEVANKSVQMDGFLKDKELHAYLSFKWKPEGAGEYRLKANVTTDITDINDTNNEFAVDVEVSEAPFELGVSANVNLPDEKLSPPFCTMAAYSQGKDPHLEDWFEDRMREWVKNCFTYGTTLSLRNAGEWSAWTLGIVALGENPNNFGGINCEGMFKKFYDGRKMGDEETEDVAWEDAFTLMALVSTGETEYEREMVVTLTRDLLSRQNEDGSWKFTYESNGKSSDTAIAIQALCAVKADLSSSSLWRDQNKAVNNGLAYLKTMQNADGSFPFLKNDSSMLATAHAVQAFIAADRAPLNGSVAYLKQQQSVYEEYLFVALNSGAYNEELNNETVPDNLREVFRRYEHGEYELSPNVAVTVTEVNECWTLLDEDNNKEYILRADGEYILVYQKKEDLNAMEQAARITAMYGQPYPAAIQTLRVRTLPDLEPTRMDTPVSAIVYTNCTVSSIVQNNGGAFNVSLLVDGKPAVTKRVYTVWSQGGTEVSFTWRPAKAGRHKLTIYCDYSDEIGECDETNNAISDFVDVRKPDLKPETLRAKTNMVSMNNTVEVTIKGTTDETYNVAFYEDDELLDKQRVNVTIGETGLNFSWMPTEKGLHNLSIDVDCDDEVEESNEGNNVKTVRVWAGLPDLYIKKHDVPALYANATNPILVDIGGIASAFNVSLLVNGTCVDTRRLTAESTEEALNTTLHWTPNRTGKYELYVAVDSGNEVPERDETNNNVTISKEVVLPDLIPVAIDTSPHLFYNESNQLTVNITGAGDEFNVSLLVSGGICSGTNCTINETEIVGKKVVSFYENISVVFAWTPDRMGVCNLTVLVDPDNDLYEANETNNNRTQTVRVYERIPVELRAPKGGETWEGVREINWHATFEKTVRIDLEYSPDRGRRWVNIVHNTENDGVFEWDTRNVMDGYDYSIKVEAYAEDAYGEAMSNLFTISNTETEESWKGFHENAGFSMSTTPNKPKLLWASQAIQAVPSSSLIVMNGNIYVFCGDGTNGWLTCLDEDSGQAVSSWGSNGKSTKGEYGESSWATPAYHNGKIYLPMKGNIYASSKSADDYFTASLGTVALHEIDAASGTAAIYHYLGGARETVNAVNGGALAAYGTVFFSTYNNGTYYKVGSEHKFAEEDVRARFEDYGNNIWVSPVTYGGWDWSYRVDYDALSTPGAGNGNIYFGEGNMGFAAGALYCVDQATGKDKWKRSFSAGVFCSPTVIGGNVYITTFGAVNKISGVYALDAVDGDRKWDKEWPTGTRASDSTPAYAPLDNGYVYVAGGGGREMDDTFVVCLDAKNGRKKWDVHSKTDEKGIEHNIGYWTNSPVVSIDKKVFVGEPTSSGGWSQFDYQGLWCLNATTGDDLWHTEYGGSTVAITNGRIYTSGAGKVFAYGPENLPDLVVGNITPEIGGDKIDGGVPVAIDVVVKNIGATDVNGTFKVALRYNEEEIGTETVDSLTMGNETVHEFWWTPPEVSQPTNYTLQAEVNPDKSVNEADLTNNRNTTEVTVCPMRPDIELVAINAPSQVKPSERCNINVDVRNNGASATNISVHLYGDGERITEWTIAALGQSEMWKNGTIWVTPPSPGDYTLKAVADKNGSIDEYNETNNEKEVSVSVKWELQTPIPPGEGPGEGPGYGGGGGGGSGGGIGLGIGPERGTGESGSEEHSGMKNPIKSSTDKEEQKHQVSGFAFGNSSAGKSGGGGGGLLYLYLLLLFLLVMTFFYMGYYKEKKAYRRIKHKK